MTLFLFILFFGSIDNNVDYDFWARLVVGKSFFQTGTLFNHDFQSYGTTHEFIDHEWGSSLVFYLIQNHFSDVGLLIFKTLMIFSTLFIITKIIRMEKPKIPLHFLFFYFTIQTVTTLIFATIRCQIFTFFFFFLYLYILKFAKKNQNYRVLWCLPVLNIVWTNMHGGFTLGLVLIGIFAFGEFLNKNKFKPYLYTFIISCLTSLINPYGIDYITFIFGAMSLNRKYINEWQSAFLNHDTGGKFFKFMVFFASANILFLFSIIKKIKLEGIKEAYNKTDKTKYLIILFCLIISLKALRCHPFFAFSVLALCYCDFYEIFNKKLPKKLDCAKEIVLFILIFISTASHFYVNPVKFYVFENLYPINCIEFLRINNLKGNLLTNFHEGSYASYKLYPNIQIFMDGRYEEVYDNDLIENLGLIFTGTDYKYVLNRFHTDFLIIDKIYPVIEQLKKDKNWFLAFEDDYYVLFLPIKYKQQKLKIPQKEKSYLYSEIKFETNIDWIK